MIHGGTLLLVITGVVFYALMMLLARWWMEVRWEEGSDSWILSVVWWAVLPALCCGVVFGWCMDVLINADRALGFREHSPRKGGR